MSKITRVSDDNSVPLWAENLLKKESVSSKSRNDINKSIYDQISAVMGNKKRKYSTVEDAVADYAEKTGLKKYLEQIKAAGELSKSANVKLFEITPAAKMTIDNVINDCRGNLPIPAIIERVRGIHKKDISDSGLWDDENLIKYVSDVISKTKSEYPTIETNYSNLGKIEPMDKNDIDISNTDGLAALNPARTGY